MARGFTLQSMACLAPVAAASEEEETAGDEETSEEEDRQQQSERMRDPNISNSNNSARGSLFGSGFSWFEKQKEIRRREHLKQEAERQLQKIAQAHRASRVEDAVVQNSSTRSSIRSVKVNRNHSLVSSSSSSSSQQDATEAEASISNWNVKSTSQTGRKSEGGFKSGSFGVSDVSKSGEGAFGTLDLSDIGIEIDTSTGKSVSINAGLDNLNQTNLDLDDDADDDIIPPVRVTQVDGDEACPYILSQDQMNEISKYVLPETITYCRWRRLYSLGRDGDSFESCLRIIGGEKRTLMVVRTTKGDVFGGYADAPWHSRKANATAHFYGSASSCLFSFSSIRTQNSNSSSPDDSPINVYRWTGKNRYIQVCDISNKMLGFGGGGDKGAFGLCLQEDFQRGTTGHCDTFDNDPLCSGDERTFDVVDVEFWEFLTGIF